MDLYISGVCESTNGFVYGLSQSTNRYFYVGGIDKNEMDIYKDRYWGSRMYELWSVDEQVWRFYFSKTLDLNHAFCPPLRLRSA